MFHGVQLKVACMLCVAGILTGVLLADGPFINFRGEEVRRAIEALADLDTSA
ncbi:MAG: hypothetical protein AAGH99_14505 [Planctomycetota bacterium]